MQLMISAVDDNVLELVWKEIFQRALDICYVLIIYETIVHTTQNTSGGLSFH